MDTIEDESQRVTAVLMCPPKYFRVEFEINPYMNIKNQVNGSKAWMEWDNLCDTVKGLVKKIEFLKPQKGIPDLVFPADLGFIVHPKISPKTVVLSNFKWPQRQSESKCYEQFFRNKGYKIVKLPKDISFEINVRETNKFYLLGYGIRNDKAGVDFLKKYFEKPVHILKLVSPWFYHLSCALSVLNNDTVMYYPKAFDDKSVKLIKRLFGNRIVLTKREAKNLAGNCIVLNGKVIVNYCSWRLIKIFRKMDIDWVKAPVDEFVKAGGAVNCMVFVLSKDWSRRVFMERGDSKCDGC